MSNLFRDYKNTERSSSPGGTTNKRAASSINYARLKKDRIQEMTLRAKDPRLSIDADPNTGIVGIVPNYKGLKNTHREKLIPFFSSSR